MLIVLSNVFINVATKSHMRGSPNPHSTESVEGEISNNALPKTWTQVPRNDLAMQTTNKQAPYISRLASVYKYTDNTKNLMKKAAQ